MVGAVADGARWALVALLTLAATEKLASLLHGTAAWHPILLASPTRRRWAGALMTTSFFVDCASVLLLIASTRLGAALALSLIVTYSWAAIPIHRQERSDCRCFFKYFKSQTRFGLLARNGWLLLLATLIFVSPPNWSSSGVVWGAVLLGVTQVFTTIADRIGDRAVRGSAGAGDLGEGLREAVGGVS